MLFLVLGYAKAGQKLFDMAMKAWDEGSDPYPIWGTCLGFELLTLFANQGQANLASCYSVDQALALNLTEQFEESNIGAVFESFLEAWFKVGIFRSTFLSIFDIKKYFFFVKQYLLKSLKIKTKFRNFHQNSD